MDGNPYSPPATLNPQTGDLRYRIFRGSLGFSWTMESIREKARKAAERAIQREIGAANVVSIYEYMTGFGSARVVVWFRIRNESA